jgi:hypothetical protein
VRGAHKTGQAGALVHINRDHQIEPEQREVGEVVLGQFFAAQVCVDGAQAAEAVGGDARPLQVGPLDAAGIADDDILDVALAVNERADLSARLER